MAGEIVHYITLHHKSLYIYVISDVFDTTREASPTFEGLG